MNHTASFVNKTVFFAPVWAESYERFVSSISKDKRYCKSDKSDVPQYMLPYITRIYCDDSFYMEFNLKKEYFPDLCMFESNFKSGGRAVIEEIRLSCFATGCAFFEFHVQYDGLSINEIADFSFNFKNADKNQDRNGPVKTSMKEAIKELLPPKAEAIAFYASSGKKNECKMFHQIRAESDMGREEITRHLIHLRRGYYKDFPIPDMGEDYDMMFEPYHYDHWAGSQEGFVNIFQLTDNSGDNNYLTRYKPIHLSVNYRFMYLILLNQRFSAIVYLGKIPSVRSYNRKQREKLNLLTSSLKTVFSFSIVSDDQLYQTIYSKMYTIMGIDRLLSDIKDNEEQIEILQSHEMLNTEKLTSSFLFALSILSLFSVLVDAAGFFDRIPNLESISTFLSVFVLCVIIVKSDRSHVVL